MQCDGRAEEMPGGKTNCLLVEQNQGRGVTHSYTPGSGTVPNNWKITANTPSGPC